MSNAAYAAPFEGQYQPGNVEFTPGTGYILHLPDEMLTKSEHPDVVTVEQHCSFCGKGASEVDALVQGPAVDLAICSECVDVASEAIAQGWTK